MCVRARVSECVRMHIRMCDKESASERERDES
jgi:hypothetical protein